MNDIKTILEPAIEGIKESISRLKDDHEPVVSSARQTASLVKEEHSRGVAGVAAAVDQVVRTVRHSVADRMTRAGEGLAERAEQVRPDASVLDNLDHRPENISGTEPGLIVEEDLLPDGEL